MVGSDRRMSADLAKNEITLKSVMAQIMAAFIGALVTMNVSAMLAAVTIVIGALKESTTEGETSNAQNSSLYESSHFQNSSKTQDFTISDTEASLYATLQLLCNLSASVIAGIIQDMFGRKKCLMTSFVFHILSWVVLNFSSNVYWLYAHGCIVGISTAFSESVVINYISEFASVSLRGRLFSVGKFGYGFGSFVTFFLGIFYTWRQLAYMLLVLPCILPFYMAFLPESPLWLLSKGREKECRRSLRWLRGWTTDEKIESEFQKLRWQANEKAMSQKEEKHINYIKLFMKPEFRQPFKIAMVLFFSSFLLNLRPARFYFINILNDMGVKADNMKIMTVTGIAGIVGCIVLGLTVHRAGKRGLTLWTFTATSFCLLLMGAYSWMHFTYNFNAVWMVYVLCTVIFFFGGYTLGGMPWFITSEIFPQRYRGLCGSITGMFAHTQIAILTNTYLYIQQLISVTNVFFLYGFISLICCYYLYRSLPETEQKSLYELEEYFKNKGIKKKRHTFGKHLMNIN